MKKIVNFTPTGTNTTRENSLAPLEPNEIVEEVCQVFEKKLITLVHIHARDKDLNNTYKAEHYRPIIEGIRRHCPDLAICTSLTGRHFNEFEKRSEVLELYPDMGSLTMSSINFPTGESINSPDTILKLIEKMKVYGVTPEIECFDSGMINYTNYLIKKGVLTGPHYINVIWGNMYNAQSDVASLNSIIQNKPNNSLLCLGGIGKEQLPSNLLGLLYADGIRIGLEDNLYYTDKVKTTNIKLLQRIRKIMNEMGLGVLSPLDFKNLGYGNRKINNTWI